MNSIDTDNYRSTIRNDLFDKAYTLWSENKDEQLYLEHSNNTYWCKVDNSKINQELTKSKGTDSRVDNTGFNFDEFMIFCRHCSITEIGNFIVEFLYFQRDSVTEESFYYSKVSNNFSETKMAISPKALANNSEFKPMIMGVLSGAIFTGNTTQLNSIFKDKTQNLKSIETIPYIGYNKKRKAYIYENFAVQNGVI